MASLELPAFPEDPQVNYEVALDGTTFRLQYRYNNRDQSVYLDLFDLTGAPIRYGIRLVSDYPLFRQIALAGRPEGELFVSATSANFDPPTFEQLGTDAIIIYNEAS